MSSVRELPARRGRFRFRGTAPSPFRCALAAGVLGLVLSGGCARRPAGSRGAEYARLEPAALQERASRGDPRALRELGYRAWSRGEAEIALEHLGQALRIEPDHSDAHNIRGMVLADRGALEAALEAFRRAAELAPRLAGPRLNIGRVRLRQGRFQEAALEFQEALKLAPGSAEAALLAADAWSSHGSPGMARLYYGKALALAPSDPRPHARLGIVLIGRGQPDRAREHLETAVRLGDRSAATRGQLGLAMALGASTPEEARRAIQELEAAIAEGERGSHVYYGMGLGLLRAREYRRAETALRDGLRQFPDVAGLFYTLADVYAATGRQEESRAARRRSADLYRLREQEERFLEEVAAAPNDTAPLLRYARWLVTRGEGARAAVPLRRAVELDPANREARRLLRTASGEPRRRGPAPPGAAPKDRKAAP